MMALATAILFHLAGAAEAILAALHLRRGDKVFAVVELVLAFGFFGLGLTFAYDFYLGSG